MILATGEDGDTTAGGAAPSIAHFPAGEVRYHDGPDEGTRGAGR